MQMLRAGALTCTIIAFAAARSAAQSSAAAARCVTVGYAVLDGTDTAMVTWHSVSDSAFSADVNARSQGALLKIGGRLAASGLVERLDISIWHAVADSGSPPTQWAQVVFSDRAALATVAARGRGAQVQHDTIPPGAMPYMNNVPIFLELVRRRAARLSADSAKVPVLWLFSGGELDTVAVTRAAADSVVLRLSVQESRLARPRAGYLGGGRIRPIGGTDSIPSQLVPLGCR